MEQYILKLTSGTSYRLYHGSTLVTDTDLTALFSTAGSAYFNFDFDSGTPSATDTAIIVDSNGVTIVTITATILDSANYKGVWGDSATTFTSFESLSGKSLDESQLSFLMGEIKESPVVGTDISTVINTAFVSTANIQSDAVTTPKIADYNVTAEKLASESVTTAKIEDGAVTTGKVANGAVTSEKIDYTSSIKLLTATVYFREGLQTTVNLRVTKLGEGLFMATGTPLGYIVATASQNFRVRTSSPLFKTIFGASGSARQEAQIGTYLKYFAAQTSNILIDSYINCPNTTTATNLYLSFIVFGELTDEMEQSLFG